MNKEYAKEIIKQLISLAEAQINSRQNMNPYIQANNMQGYHFIYQDIQALSILIDENKGKKCACDECTMLIDTKHSKSDLCDLCQ